MLLLKSTFCQLVDILKSLIGHKKNTDVSNQNVKLAILSVITGTNVQTFINHEKFLMYIRLCSEMSIQ